MKKTYLTPALKVEEGQAAQMLAESLSFYNDTIDNSDEILVKGSSPNTNDVNVWDEEW